MKTLCETAKERREERTGRIETEGRNAWLGMNNTDCFLLSSLFVPSASPVTWGTYTHAHSC